MSKEYSPFSPGVPVPIEFFIGRTEEIKRVIGAARKSVSRSSIERCFVTGDRGIGKSSLCRFALTLAERDLNLLGLHVFLGGVHTLEEMIRRILERLIRESRDRPWFETVRRIFGDHVKEVGLFGITLELDSSDKFLARAVSDFVPTLKHLLKQIRGQREGIILVLDDLNGLAGTDPFANWLKSMVDEIATSRDPIPLTLVLVGLAERRTELIRRQPSLNRVFDLILIDKFSAQEASEFFIQFFAAVGVPVEREALALMTRYSGGYPVLMHEIGDSVFQVDEDDHIDEKDAFSGIVRAAEVVGAKYIEPGITSAVRSEKYKSILKKIARTPFGHRFLRKEVVSGLTEDEARVFDNFLRRMERLGVVGKDLERGPGSYIFTREIYYLFFWLQALRELRIESKSA
ncbi:MAG: AAA family ATPase [Candidatus Omnitrophica bacterium]|nr:AAA family ATPase [Candidatus Omnitrophota bacterium]